VLPGALPPPGRKNLPVEQVSGPSSQNQKSGFARGLGCLGFKLNLTNVNEKVNRKNFLKFFVKIV